MKFILTMALVLSAFISLNAKADVYDMCKDEVITEQLTEFGASSGNCKVQFDDGKEVRGCAGRKFEWTTTCRMEGVVNSGSVCCNEQR